MTNKITEQDKVDVVLNEKDFFDAIEKARQQYDIYVKLTTFAQQDLVLSSNSFSKRDVNYPLTVVIK